jgi:hypothetical protein
MAILCCVAKKTAFPAQRVRELNGLEPKKLEFSLPLII